MSWAGLLANQTVSCNNLQDAVNTGVFTAKTSIPATNKEITASQANTYVNFNTGNSSYASKASNQLVVKRNLTNSSDLLYGYSFTSSPYGTLNPYSTSALACALGTYGTAGVAWNGVLTTGTVLYSTYLYPTVVFPVGYYYLQGYWVYNSVQTTSYMTVSSIGSCSPPTYTVTIHAKQSTARSGRYVWYSTNGGSSYTKISSPAVSTSDQSFGNISVTSGTTLILAIGDNIDINDGTTAASVGVGAYASLPSGCPGRVSPPAIFANQTVYLYGNSTSYDLACT